jgi:transaldolase/glucose-6-phosphate isomerase
MTVSVSINNPDALTEVADRWSRHHIVERMWQRDATVWADPIRPEIENRLGWLDLPKAGLPLVETAAQLADDAVRENITDIVLCGMGGSSPAPEVFASVLPQNEGTPNLTVIDTTHPDAVEAVSDQVDPRSAWYVIASKSGGTLETMSLFRYFWAQSSALVDEPGSRFIAITDPGSSLATLAMDRSFRATVLADETVGGRFSALSAFGLIPSGLIGGPIDVLLKRATDAMDQCRPDVTLLDNPGFVIGAAMATAAFGGSNKAYFDCSKPLLSLGVWIEQLIAESTGKESKGIIPIDGGPRPSPDAHSYTVAIGANPSPRADLSISVSDAADVAGVMYVLEFATAVAGEILGIHPFDQPDVQLAKSLAAKAMEGELSATGPVPLPIHDQRVVALMRESLGGETPSYVSVHAYLPSTAQIDRQLAELRQQITSLVGCYATVGYGPRFLHSTGQLHKGGPAGGVYIQITDTPETQLSIPETDYSFNELIAAQAAGDRAALVDLGRMVIPVHTSRVSSVTEAVEQALSG